jgi:5-methylthioadenosine/S-adenosylhomocysteine deaminase
VNIALGTDSTMTGSLNLLEEMRTAREAFRAQTNQDPSSRWLVELVTTHAAYALMLEDRRGKIAPGYEADLLVLPDLQRDPYVTLVEAQITDISLLVCGGIPIYGDPHYRSLFEQFSPQFTSVFVSKTPADAPRPGQVKANNSAEKLIAGDPLSLLERISRAVGHHVRLPFLPFTTQPQKSNTP